MTWLPTHQFFRRRSNRKVAAFGDSKSQSRTEGTIRMLPKEHGRSLVASSTRPAHLFLLLFLSALLAVFAYGVARAGQVTLSWDPNGGGAEVVGYRIYYGTDGSSYSSFVDVGNQTTGTLTNLQEGAVYYAVATSYDAQGTESSYSNQVSFVTSSNTASSGDGGGGGGGGGGGCFIATAAFGSYMDPHVRVLRTFRDVCLLTNRPGRLFVRLYYAASPAIAGAIRENEALRAGVRTLLVPVVGFGYLSMTIGFWQAGLFALLFFAFLAWLGRRLLSMSRPSRV
jgi:hypothetical protein